MIYLFLHAIAIYITSYLTGVGIHGFSPKSIGISFLVVIVLLFLNWTVKPLLTLVTIPLHIITFGLFSFVINGISIKLASMIVPGFIIPSFYMAVWFAFVLSIINWVVDRFRNDR
jgi:putative membrane protein